MAKLSETTLKFNNIRLNKKEFHKSKEPIDLMSVIVDQIVVSDKCKHNNEAFNDFIGYKRRWNCRAIMYYFTANERIHKSLRKRW